MIRLSYCMWIFLLISSVCLGQDYTLPLWTDNIPNYQKTDEVEVRDTTNAVRIGYVQQPDQDHLSDAVPMPVELIAIDI